MQVATVLPVLEQWNKPLLSLIYFLFYTYTYTHLNKCPTVRGTSFMDQSGRFMVVMFSTTETAA